jgi:hypothetical protein
MKRAGPSGNRTDEDTTRTIETAERGERDRTIIGLIVQQTLTLGVSGFALGVALTATFKGYFPRRVQMEPRDVAILFVIVIVMCLLASALSVRTAVEGGSGHGACVGLAMSGSVSREPLVELRGVSKRFDEGKRASTRSSNLCPSFQERSSGSLAPAVPARPHCST